MPRYGPDSTLDEISAEWVARMDRGPLSADDAHKLEAWLAASSKHRGSYARAQAAFAFMNVDFVKSLDGFEVPRGGVSRRQALYIGGGAAAAAAAAGAVAVFETDNLKPAVNYSAQKGQVRLISLTDGSLVTLDTDSTVAVQFLPDQRKVELLRGRALFTVAKDKKRPFAVTAADFKVEAVGTSFAVRNMKGMPREVLVQEGIVDVEQSSEQSPVRVGANTRVVASAGPGLPLSVSTVDPSMLSSELLWRQGVIAFEDVTLAVAAAELSRYSDTRIIITDPTIASITITGLFSATNPTGFARAAALSLGLKVDLKDQEIRLHRS